MCALCGLTWDHPRRCGEKRKRGRVCRVCVGSPPQVRGKGLHLSLYPADGRITPAGAGKRLYPCCLASFLRDHPRRCGEKDKIFKKIFLC